MARVRHVHGGSEKHTEISRRSIFALLAGLPFVGRLFAGDQRSHTVLERFPPGHRILSSYMWYENAEGTRAYVDLSQLPLDRPRGYDYYVSRFPRELRTEHYRIEADGASKLLMAGSETFPEDLVLALVQNRGYSLCEAILLACSCERCINSLAYSVGLSWGYPEDSPQWQQARTSCEWCRGVEGQNKA